MILINNICPACNREKGKKVAYWSGRKPKKCIKCGGSYVPSEKLGDSVRWK